MIGSFLAFGVNGGLAVLAVLAYRTISYWLPTVPGAIAYVRLRHHVRNSGGTDQVTVTPSPATPARGGADASARSAA
jgi:hypothetical protein